MNQAPNHFALFGIEPRFGLDPVQLEAAYKRVQAQVHPDRYASGTAVERRVAMQWAARANEAFSTLKSPARRAAYLCESNGTPIRSESNTAMPSAFLLQQMQWREALDEARSAQDAATLAVLAEQTAGARNALLAQLGETLDVAHDYEKAAAMVRQLMFVDKFSDEVHFAMDHPLPFTRSSSGS